MVEDAAEHLSQVDRLEKDIKSLKGSVGNLKGRIRDIEAPGFQNQLIALDKTTKTITKSLKVLEIAIAETKLDQEAYWLTTWLENLAEKNPTLNIGCQQCINHTREVGALLKGTLRSMDEPLTVLDDFDKRVRPKMEQFGLARYYFAD